MILTEQEIAEATEGLHADIDATIEKIREALTYRYVNKAHRCLSTIHVIRMRNALSKLHDAQRILERSSIA